MRRIGFGARGGAITVQCKECGTEFTKLRCDPQVYCSVKCSLPGRARSRRRRVDRVCKQCGKSFEIRFSQAIRKGKHTGQFCSRECCYAYWRANPQEHPSTRSKLQNGGAERLDSQGYVWVYVPGRGSVRQHILVMEHVLGRPIQPWESIHHKNGVRSDNRPENLELWTGKHPAGERASDAILTRLSDIEARLAAIEAVLSPVK